VREIAERRVVLFVGAGVSKSAVPTLPSWPSLLKNLAERPKLKKDRELAKRLIRGDKLLDAAELLNSLMTAAERRAFLEKNFQLTPTPTSDLYRHLLDLDIKVCITTNYDQLLEKNFEHYSGGQPAYQSRTYRYDNFLADLRSPTRTILKLHGCITEPAQIVLDRKSYFRAKAENPGIYDAVLALSTVNTVLFLGYSMSDPDIQLLLETIHARSNTDHTHYALISKLEHPSLRDALSETYNVKFIEYAKGDHAEFPKAIENLRDDVKAERAGLGVP
jgi:hypothetical protein